MDGNRYRSWILAAAAVGLALRLAFALGYWVGQTPTRDEREYLSLARSLAAGRGFTYDASLLSGSIEPFNRAPGYPVFLALTGGGRSDGDSVPTSVKIAQAIVGTMGVVIAGAIGRRLAGDRAGAAAAAIAAIYPPLVWIAAYAFSEAIAWPLGLLAAWRFDAMLDAEPAQRTRAALVTGLMTGLAILVRPGMIFFLGLAALWLLWRRHPRLAVWFVASTIVVVGPWTVRNYLREGRLILVAAEGGVTFWTGNHPLARGEGDMAANPELKIASNALKAAHPGLDEVHLEPIYYREALDWIRAHPIDWLGLEARKLFYLVVPIGRSYWLHSPRYALASVVSYVLALSLALIGIIRIGSNRGRVPGLWLLLGSAIVLCLVFFPQERFRIPAIDPALVILAGAVWSTRTAKAIA
jgi:4-amino-4-deoxy-L-arabinose transferase-like glycosyltransferase